jgi:hypothetical protein
MSDINTTINTINSVNGTNYLLVSKEEALLHFEETLKNIAGITVNLSNPKPYLVDKTGKPTTLTSIKTVNTLSKDIIIKGKANTKIYKAFNSDGNSSNLSFIDTNKRVGSDRNGYLTLDFNDDNITHFHYFIKLIDDNNISSETLHLDVLKDLTPPHVANTNIIEEVIEEQLLFRNVQATDVGGIQGYRVITSGEDNRSINASLFTIDSNGTITFKVEPNFDENINAIFSVVTRAIDYAGNMTDLLLQVILKNILDNPPVLTATQYTTSLIEGLSNGTTVFDLNTTLQWDLDLAPDNDPTLSPIYFHLNNYTTLFDINETTGVITVKNNTNGFFDYEQLPNTIDLNVSVENNNSHPLNDINTTYATLTVSIVNKIDTTPTLIVPSPLSIPEESSNYTSDYPIGGILIDEPSSDKNLTMTFSIESGNIGNNFSIDPITGIISVKNSNTLDYETIKQYSLLIRATNTWTDNNSTHYDEVNQTINIIDVRDNAPSIVLKDLNNSIPESTLSNVTIATFDVNGTNVDENATTFYTIKDSTLKNGVYITPSSIPFTINNSGVLSTSRQLLNDYVESLLNTTDTVFTITIEALNSWWNGSTGTSNPITFDVNLTNVIDNAPIISISPTLVNFDENTTIGTIIYDVNTSGSTFDTNSDTNFTIVSGNTDNKFTINTTGTLTLLNALDWETTTSYSLGIQASNIHWDGSEHNSSIQNLTINVNNIIEKVPSIYVPSSITLHENIDDGYILTTLEINSTEVDEQNITSLTLLPSSHDGNFVLGTDDTDNSIKNIKVKVNNTIDYEDTASSYTLEINATNTFGSKIYTIPIEIIDDVEKDLPLIVIAMEYDDLNITTSLASIENLLFKEGFSGSKYLKNYFERVSKGKFYFKAATPETYDNDTNGIIKVKLTGNHPQDGTTALDNDIREALIAADSFIDFSAFDTKRVDGNISADELQILCIVAGGEKTYGDVNRSILAKSDAFDSAITLDGVKVAYNNGGGNFAVVGELQNNNPLTIGLVAKMLSQSALNFKLQGDSYTFGDFDLMGLGYDGYIESTSKGTTPVHPSVYNKAIQGWTTPTTLKNNRVYSTIPLTYANSVIAYNTYKINDSIDPNIYYLLEYRDSSPIGTAGNNYDNGLYKINDAIFSGGLKIWKINNNNGASKVLEPVIISNTTDNIFRPTNALTDIPLNNAFEFTDKGTIDTNNNIYSIGITTK